MKYILVNERPTQVFVNYIDPSVATVPKELKRFDAVKALFKHMPVYSSKETRKAQAIRDHDLEYQNEIKARLYQLEGKH